MHLYRKGFVHMEADFDQELDLDLDTDQDVEEESPYKVIIHNDDVTPMDFVVSVLLKIFKLMLPDAEQIMLIAHLRGIAYVQTLPKSEAKKRVGKAHFAANLEGYPLKFTLEPD